MAIHRILAPIDLSTDSLNALTYARNLAKRCGAELVILHVVEPIDLGDSAEWHLSQRELELLDEQRRARSAQLERLATDLKKQGQRVRTMVQRGAPAQVIVDTAKRTRSDLVVMGTRGRTGLAHMLIGSVAERVVRSAHCPVLTVRRVARKPRASKK